MVNMKCPSCDTQLSTLDCGDIQVEACTQGCGGVWFDERELHKFDEPHEFSSSRIVQLAEERNEVRVDHNKLKKCPKCPNEVLVRQFFDIKREIEIDQCWNCSGIWLDVGELNSLRSQYETFVDRAKEANAYLDSYMAEVTADINKRSKEQVEHYNKVTKNRFAAAKHALKALLGAE